MPDFAHARLSPADADEIADATGRAVGLPSGVHSSQGTEQHQPSSWKRRRKVGFSLATSRRSWPRLACELYCLRPDPRGAGWPEVISVGTNSMCIEAYIH